MGAHGITKCFPERGGEKGLLFVGGGGGGGGISYIFSVGETFLLALKKKKTEWETI